MSETTNAEGQSHDLIAHTLPAEKDGFPQIFWEKLVEQSSVVPLGIEPAFWPVRVMDEYIDTVANRAHITDERKAAFAAQIAPLEGSLYKLRTAYGISAYSHCKNEDYQAIMKNEVEADQRINSRDTVELNNQELGILQRFCETPRYSLQRGGQRMLEPRIPFDPQRKVFKHAEIIRTPLPPQNPQITDK